MKKILTYTVGLIVAALIMSAVAMANALIRLSSDGCVIWGIIIIALGVLLNIALDALVDM